MIPSIKSTSVRSICFGMCLGMMCLLVLLVQSSDAAFAAPRRQDNPTGTALQATIFFLQTGRAPTTSGINLTSTAQQATIQALMPQATTPPAPAAAGQLEVGKEAVVTEAGDEIYVLNAPKRGATRLAVRLKGHHVLVIGGPSEADSYRWWQVQLIENITGWMVEGADGETWLAPATDAPQVQVLRTLSPSNLFVGARIKLSLKVNPGIAVRAEPDVSGELLFRISDPELVFNIVDGPALGNDLRWWKIRYTSERMNLPNTYGWVSEGQGQVKNFDVLYPVGIATNVRGGHVKVGDIVRVTSSGDGARLRQEPSRTSPAVNTIGVGVNATVLEGPQDRDGFRYWRIERSDGYKGWIGVQPGWLEVYQSK